LVQQVEKPQCFTIRFQTELCGESGNCIVDVDTFQVCAGAVRFMRMVERQPCRFGRQDIIERISASSANLQAELDLELVSLLLEPRQCHPIAFQVEVLVETCRLWSYFQSVVDDLLTAIVTGSKPQPLWLKVHRL
jgi:hypothetical protein